MLGCRLSVAAARIRSACEVLGGSRSLRVIVGAVASSWAAVDVARRSLRRCLRHRAGAPGASSVVLPCARRLNARPPLFRCDGSLSRRGASCSAAHALCLYSLARLLPLWRRSPSRDAHAAFACGTALALLALDLLCRRPRGGVALGRNSSAKAARSLGVVRRARRLPLSACTRWRDRFPSGSGQRCTTLTAPRPAAPDRRSWRRLARAAALAAGWRSAAALPWQQLFLSAQCEVVGGSSSLRVALGAVASSLAAVAVARRSPFRCLRRIQRRCLRRRAGAPGAGFIDSPLSRRRGTRPPLSVAAARFSARFVVLGGSCALRVVVGADASSLSAVAVARRSRRRCLRRSRRCLRRRTGAPGAGLLVPPRLPRRDARPPNLPWQRLAFVAQCVVLGDSRFLRVVVDAVASSLAVGAVARRSRRRSWRRLCRAAVRAAA